MNAYDVITDRIIAQLESGTVPWRKPWGGEQLWPRNLASGKNYRGVNVFLLAVSSYSSPYWLTFKQAQTLGGTVRKGEKATPVIFWSKWTKPDRNAPEERPAGDDQTSDLVSIPFLKTYSVFNVAQCDLPNGRVPMVEGDGRNAFERIEACDRIVSAMQNPPAIRHGFDRACYSPYGDEVRMPNQTAFDSSEGYYATLFHEMGHATGHSSRLARKGITEPQLFGTDAYGREELVAEMTAAFLCGHAGIDTATIDNAASYVAGWLRTIREDSKLVVIAAAQAQKAADMILGRSWDEQGNERQLCAV